VYPRWEVDVTSWLAWLPFVLLVAAGVVLWRWRADVARPLRFVLGYYVLCLLPVLGFVNIYFMRYSLVADHYQYLALMGVLALAAAALAELGARWRATGAVGAASAVLVVVLGWMTWREQSAWRDEETLWRATLARNPDAWMAHNNLGVLRFRRGATVEAISHYETALRLDPDYAGAHHNLGDALQSQGRFDDAIAHYRETTRLEPKFADAHNNLGNALLATRRFDEAVASFRAALELRPDHALAHVNLGSALDELGRCEEAVAEHEAALRLDPSLAVAHYDLGNSLQKLGRAPEAARHYERALELAPNTAAFENKLAWLLATSSQLDPRRAVELAQRVVKRTGSRESVPLDTLAAAHAAAGDFDQAVRVALQAVELAPPALQAAMRQRLDGYRAGRPWREEPVARPTSH
jgi:tetratricopeptide (TPR) repeat protein